MTYRVYLQCDKCGDTPKSKRRAGDTCGLRIVTQEAQWPNRPRRTMICTGTLVPMQQPRPRPRP